jgi:hypothetical protein
VNSLRRSQAAKLYDSIKSALLDEMSPDVSDESPDFDEADGSEPSAEQKATERAIDSAQRSREQHAQDVSKNQAYQDAIAEEAEETHAEDVEDEAAEEALEENADDILDDLLKASLLDKDKEEGRKRRRRQEEEEEEEIEAVGEVREVKTSKSATIGVKESLSTQLKKKLAVETAGPVGEIGEITEGINPDVVPTAGEGTEPEEKPPVVGEPVAAIGGNMSSETPDMETPVKEVPPAEVAPPTQEAEEPPAQEAPPAEQAPPTDSAEAPESPESEALSAEQELVRAQQESNHQEQVVEQATAVREAQAESRQQVVEARQVAETKERQASEASNKTFRLELESTAVVGQAERAENEAELISSKAQDEMGAAEARAFDLRRKAALADPEEAALLKAQAENVLQRARAGKTEARQAKQTASSASKQAQLISQTVDVHKERYDRSRELQVQADEFAAQIEAHHSADEAESTQQIRELEHSSPTADPSDASIGGARGPGRSGRRRGGEGRPPREGRRAGGGGRRHPSTPQQGRAPQQGRHGQGGPGSQPGAGQPLPPQGRPVTTQPGAPAGGGFPAAPRTRSLPSVRVGTAAPGAFRAPAQPAVQGRRMNAYMPRMAKALEKRPQVLQSLSRLRTLPLPNLSQIKAQVGAAQKRTSSLLERTRSSAQTLSRQLPPLPSISRMSAGPGSATQSKWTDKFSAFFGGRKRAAGADPDSKQPVKTTALGAAVKSASPSRQAEPTKVGGTTSQSSNSKPTANAKQSAPIQDPPQPTISAKESSKSPSPKKETAKPTANSQNRPRPAEPAGTTKPTKSDPVDTPSTGSQEPPRPATSKPEGTTGPASETQDSPKPHATSQGGAEPVTAESPGFLGRLSDAAGSAIDLLSGGSDSEKPTAEPPKPTSGAEDASKPSANSQDAAKPDEEPGLLGRLSNAAGSAIDLLSGGSSSEDPAPTDGNERPNTGTGLPSIKWNGGLPSIEFGSSSSSDAQTDASPKAPSFLGNALRVVGGAVGSAAEAVGLTETGKRISGYFNPEPPSPAKPSRLTGTIGRLAGTAVGAVFPPFGGMVGPAIGAAASAISKLPPQKGALPPPLPSSKSSGGGFFGSIGRIAGKAMESAANSKSSIGISTMDRKSSTIGISSVPEKKDLSSLMGGSITKDIVMPTSELKTSFSTDLQEKLNMDVFKKSEFGLDSALKAEVAVPGGENLSQIEERIDAEEQSGQVEGKDGRRSSPAAKRKKVEKRQRQLAQQEQQAKEEKKAKQKLKRLAEEAKRAEKEAERAAAQLEKSRGRIYALQMEQMGLRSAVERKRAKEALENELKAQETVIQTQRTKSRRLIAELRQHEAAISQTQQSPVTAKPEAEQAEQRPATQPKAAGPSKRKGRQVAQREDARPQTSEPRPNLVAPSAASKPTEKIPSINTELENLESELKLSDTPVAQVEKAVDLVQTKSPTGQSRPNLVDSASKLGEITEDVAAGKTSKVKQLQSDLPAPTPDPVSSGGTSSASTGGSASLDSLVSATVSAAPASPTKNPSSVAPSTGGSGQLPSKTTTSSRPEQSSSSAPAARSQSDLPTAPSETPAPSPVLPDSQPIQENAISPAVVNPVSQEQTLSPIETVAAPTVEPPIELAVEPTLPPKQEPQGLRPTVEPMSEPPKPPLAETKPPVSVPEQPPIQSPKDEQELKLPVQLPSSEQPVEPKRPVDARPPIDTPPPVRTEAPISKEAVVAPAVEPAVEPQPPKEESQELRPAVEPISKPPQTKPPVAEAKPPVSVPEKPPVQSPEDKQSKKPVQPPRSEQPVEPKKPVDAPPPIDKPLPPVRTEAPVPKAPPIAPIAKQPKREESKTEVGDGRASFGSGKKEADFAIQPIGSTDKSEGNTSDGQQSKPISPPEQAVVAPAVEPAVQPQPPKEESQELRPAVEPIAKPPQTKPPVAETKPPVSVPEQPPVQSPEDEQSKTPVQPPRVEQPVQPQKPIEAGPPTDIPLPPVRTEAPVPKAPPIAPIAKQPKREESKTEVGDGRASFGSGKKEADFAVQPIGSTDKSKSNTTDGQQPKPISPPEQAVVAPAVEPAVEPTLPPKQESQDLRPAVEPISKPPQPKPPVAETKPPVSVPEQPPVQSPEDEQSKTPVQPPRVEQPVQPQKPIEAGPPIDIPLPPVRTEAPVPKAPPIAPIAKQPKREESKIEVGDGRASSGRGKKEADFAIQPIGSTGPIDPVEQNPPNKDSQAIVPAVEPISRPPETEPPTRKPDEKSSPTRPPATKPPESPTIVDPPPSPVPTSPVGEFPIGDSNQADPDDSKSIIGEAAESDSSDSFREEMEEIRRAAEAERKQRLREQKAKAERKKRKAKAEQFELGVQPPKQTKPPADSTPKPGAPKPGAPVPPASEDPLVPEAPPMIPISDLIGSNPKSGMGRSKYSAGHTSGEIGLAVQPIGEGQSSNPLQPETPPTRSAPVTGEPKNELGVQPPKQTTPPAASIPKPGTPIPPASEEPPIAEAPPVIPISDFIGSNPKSGRSKSQYSAGQQSGEIGLAVQPIGEGQSSNPLQPETPPTGAAPVTGEPKNELGVQPPQQSTPPAASTPKPGTPIAGAPVPEAPPMIPISDSDFIGSNPRSGMGKSKYSAGYSTGHTSGEIGLAVQPIGEGQSSNPLQPETPPTRSAPVIGEPKNELGVQPPQQSTPPTATTPQPGAPIAGAPVPPASAEPTVPEAPPMIPISDSDFIGSNPRSGVGNSQYSAGHTSGEIGLAVQPIGEGQSSNPLQPETPPTRSAPVTGEPKNELGVQPPQQSTPPTATTPQPGAPIAGAPVPPASAEPPVPEAPPMIPISDSDFIGSNPRSGVGNSQYSTGHTSGEIGLAVQPIGEGQSSNQLQPETPPTGAAPVTGEPKNELGVQPPQQSTPPAASTPKPGTPIAGAPVPEAPPMIPISDSDFIGSNPKSGMGKSKYSAGYSTGHTSGEIGLAVQPIGEGQSSNPLQPETPPTRSAPVTGEPKNELGVQPPQQSTPPAASTPKPGTPIAGAPVPPASAEPTVPEAPPMIPISDSDFIGSNPRSGMGKSKYSAGYSTGHTSGEIGLAVQPIGEGQSSNPLQPETPPTRSAPVTGEPKNELGVQPPQQSTPPAASTPKPGTPIAGAPVPPASEEPPVPEAPPMVPISDFKGSDPKSSMGQSQYSAGSSSDEIGLAVQPIGGGQSNNPLQPEVPPTGGAPVTGEPKNELGIQPPQHSTPPAASTPKPGASPSNGYEMSVPGMSSNPKASSTNPERTNNSIGRAASDLSTVETSAGSSTGMSDTSFDSLSSGSKSSESGPSGTVSRRPKSSGATFGARSPKMPSSTGYESTSSASAPNRPMESPTEPGREKNSMGLAGSQQGSSDGLDGLSRYRTTKRKPPVFTRSERASRPVNQQNQEDLADASSVQPAEQTSHNLKSEPNRRWDDDLDADGAVIFQRSKSQEHSKDGGEELFISRRRKTDSESESVIFDSSESSTGKRVASESEQTRARKAAFRPAASGEVPPIRTAWSAERLFDLDSDDWKQLDEDQRVVKKTLLDLTTPQLKIGRVRMTDDTSKVYAKVEDNNQTDSASVGYLKLRFREKTGRELIIEAPENTKTPVQNESIEVRPDKVSPLAATPANATLPLVDDEAAPSEQEIRQFDAYKKTERKPKVFRRSQPATSLWGAAVTPETVADSKAPSSAADDEASVKRLRGRGRANKAGQGAQKAQGKSGGGRAQRGHSRYRKQHHDKQKGNLEQKDNELGGALREKIDTDTGLKVEVLRIGLQESKDEEGSGQGQQQDSSSCSTCGTTLPASQAQSCPICAQSGQDVMALTKVNYRFAGSKMFAAADTVVASAGAKKLIQSGGLDQVASLRYWPKLPGHKDIWNLRRA